MTSALDVEALAEAAAGGDKTALGQLYETHDRQVFGYVYRRVSSHAVAEDVCADVWLRVVTSIRTYTSRPGCGFLSWLFTITRNLLQTRYRNASRRPGATSDLVLVQQPCARPGPLETAVRTERAAEVIQALGRLTPPQRTALTLRYLDGLSQEETAEHMGTTVGAVKLLTHRGKKTLRMRLDAQEPDTLLSEGAGLSA